MRIGIILLIIYVVRCVRQTTQSPPSYQPSLICETCHFFINTVRKGLESREVFETINFFIHYGCRLFFNNYFCEATEYNYVQPFYRNLVERIFRPEEVCVKMLLCKYPKLILDLDQDYRNRVLKDKPITRRPKVGPNPQKQRFVVMTDMHIDYKYQEGAETKCREMVCCRNNSASPDGVTQQKAGKYGMVAKCDIPQITAYCMLDYMMDEIKPDFILWLGDNEAHNVWEWNKKSHMDNTVDVTQKLKTKYGKLGQLYPLIGNHEGFPCDFFDLKTGSHQWILDNATQLWSSWLTEESQKVHRRIGCYSQLHTDGKLRIIAVFPMVSDIINPFTWKNGTNPWKILDWLETELRKSERNKESVYILNHFATGTFFMNKQWGYRYSVLLERFTNIIRGVFSGHTHEDSFQIVTSSDGKETSGIIQVNPAATTYPTINPSFRVYEMDVKTHTLLDYTQYRFYINESNELGKPVIREAYRFKQFFNLPSMDYNQYWWIIRRMKENSTYWRETMNMLWAEGPKGDKLIAECPAALNFMICHYSTGNIYDLNECANWKYCTLENFFGYGLLARYSVPDWAIAIYEQLNQ